MKKDVANSANINRRTDDGFAEVAPSVLAIVSVILILCRVVFHFTASPIPDEAYYWLWGQNPDLSYFDHPPLQAWMQTVSSALFGTNLFALRFPTLATTATLIFVIVWWQRQLRPNWNNRAVWTTLLIVFSSPLFFIFTTITFNDHVFIALLALTTVPLSQLLSALDRGEKLPAQKLYLTAFLIGLSGLTKYNAALFGLGALLTAAIVPAYRPVFRSWHIIPAIILCLLCLTPVMIWNYQNDWASFQFHLSERFVLEKSVAKAAEHFVSFVVFSTLLLSPMLVWAILKSLKPKPNETTVFYALRNINRGVLALTTIVWLIVSYHTHLFYYWNIAAYVAILPLCLIYLHKSWQVVTHLIYGTVIILIFTITYSIFPVISWFGAVDPEISMLYDWKRVSTRAEALASQHQTDFTIVSDYRAGSILAFWLDDKETKVISKRNSQFNYWFDQDGLANKNALIMTDDWHPMSDVIRNQFESVTHLQTHMAQRFGYDLKTYNFYLGKGYLPINNNR